MRLAVTLAASLVTSPAYAAGADDIASRWTIGSVAADDAEHVAKVGETIWKQPLYSSALVTLAAPARNGKGKQILPAGAELMAMAAGDRMVFCETTPRKASGAEMFLMGSLGETASCLIDTGKDGEFDGYFTKKVQYEGFPVIRGGLPDVPKPLMPLPYTVRTGGATKGAYWVGMRYAGGDRDSEAQRFEIVFGGNEDKSALSNATVGPRGAFPRTVELLGARIAILSVTDGAMHYRIEQPMPEQDFSVLRTFIPG